jgi:hypothetical protein
MSMFNEKTDSHEISVAVSRGTLVKIRFVDNKKYQSILMSRERALELSNAIILIAKKIRVNDV